MFIGNSTVAASSFVVKNEKKRKKIAEEEMMSKKWRAQRDVVNTTQKITISCLFSFFMLIMKSMYENMS
jgi:hypothetical protein